MYKNLYEFYSAIDNPVNNKSNLENIVNVYSKSCSFEFRNNLFHTRKPDKSHKDILDKNKNNYYVYLFNLWKDYITKIDYNNFMYLKKYRYLNDDFLDLQRYLKSIPYASSYDNVIKYMNPDNINLKLLILRYGFSVEKKNDWNCIYSEIITADQAKHFDAENFLTVTCKDYDIYKFLMIFNMKCTERNLPYYYKFNTTKGTSDNIIVYSDSEHLLDYLKIIEDIKAAYPNLISRCEKPSPVVGTIDGFIGYGSNSNYNEDEFYYLRCHHLYNCVNSVYLNFIKNNYMNEIKGKNSSMQLIDFLAASITIKFLDMNNNMDKYYNLIYTNVKKDLEKKFSSKEKSSFNNIVLMVNNNKNIVISKFLIEDTIRESASEVFNKFPFLYKVLSDYINETSQYYGISDKYCFSEEAIVSFNKIIKNQNSQYTTKK